MGQLLPGRRLEGGDAHPLRVDLAHDVAHACRPCRRCPSPAGPAAGCACPRCVPRRTAAPAGRPGAGRAGRARPSRRTCCRRSRAWPPVSIALRSTGPDGQPQQVADPDVLGAARPSVSFADVFGMVMIVSADTRLGQRAVLGRFGRRDVTAGVGPARPARSPPSSTAGRRRSRLPTAAGGAPTYRLLGHGADYAFLLDGDRDAAARPALARGSRTACTARRRVYDHARFAWTDAGWRGVALPGLGRLRAARRHVHRRRGRSTPALERLDHLVDLGVDLVELMPVAAFPGRHGWGYDGVHLYAVHEPYGGPDALKRFVDACHARGLGVCLDVVYNHLGPSRELPAARSGPTSPTSTRRRGARRSTSTTRAHARCARWIIDNALMWLRDYHLDALRLDAVHALVDDSPVHLLAELSREVDALSDAVRRPLSLIAESDLNQPATVAPVEAGGLGMTAQWSDDFHHALHTLLTGEGQGYYGDFAADPFEALRADADRGVLPRRDLVDVPRRGMGRPVDRARVPGWRFLGYLQTHDQVGNRAIGDRLAVGLSPGPGPGRGGAGADLAVHADAVHGRGVGGVDAVAVLHLPRGARAGRGGAGGPAAGVRRARLGRGATCPTRRPRRRSRASTLDWSESVRRGNALRDAGLVPVADRAAAGRAVAVGPAAGPGVGGV